MLTKKHFALAACMTGLIGCASNPAQLDPSVAEISKTDYSSLVASALGSKAKLDSTFEAGGMTGVIISSISNPDQKAVGWVINDGKALAFGPVFNADGTNLTASASPELSSQPTPVASRFSEGDFSSALGIPLYDANASSSTLYVLADPECAYCQKLFTEMAGTLGDAQSSGVAIQWVPVSVLGDASTRKGIAMLKAQHKEVANESEFESAVLSNTRLLGVAPQMATPTLVWFKDGELQYHVGALTKTGLQSLYLQIREGDA